MFYKSIASSQITIPTESVADLSFGPRPAQHTRLSSDFFF